MLNRVAKLLLVLTSFAPVLLTYAFLSWLRGGFWWSGAGFLGAALGLLLVAVAIIRQAARRLEAFDVEIVFLKTVDQEIVGFLVAYLLPLVTQPSIPAIDWRVGAFILSIFFVVIWGTHSYHFNPLLGILGYHFFEVRTSNSVTYVMITRKDLRTTRGVNRVVQVSEYMLLDATGGRQ